MTLRRTRIVVLPTINLPAAVRVGTAVFQRMSTVGSMATEPESSTVVDFACAGAAQIMLNARPKKKVER